MIEFKDVSISFMDKKKKVEAVKRVSFEINRGEIFGIIGSSGAGKSTLLRTINNLQKTTEGTVIIDGEDINAMNKKQIKKLRQKTGMIFQHFNLIQNKTVFENVAFSLQAIGKSKEEIKKRVHSYLEFVQLTDKINEYPAALSGGQKQRVAIARALANDAKILLCDEPTSALDLETTKTVLELLKKANQKFGVTIVIITHELEVVKEICNRVAVMHQGEVTELNDVYSVFSKPENIFTKQLIDISKKEDLPEKVKEKEKGVIVHISYLGDKAYEPVISTVIRKYDVNLNVLGGKIEYVSDKPIGDLFVSLDGEQKVIDEILEYIKNNVEYAEVV